MNVNQTIGKKRPRKGLPYLNQEYVGKNDKNKTSSGLVQTGGTSFLFSRPGVHTAVKGFPNLHIRNCLIPGTTFDLNKSGISNRN